MQEAWDTLEPGIDFSPGTPADFLLDVFAQMHAETLQTLTQQLAVAFRGSLEKVDRVFQRDATQATADATLVRTDSPERLVPAGTEFNLLGADGQPVAFQTVNDVTFAAADTSEAVALIAVNGGTAGNGLSTVIGPAVTSTWYGSLTISGTTSGGEDGETDDEYLDRAADERPGRAFTIVLPDDLDRYLRNQPGVDRALVINRYDPLVGNNQPGHITAFPIDETGAALSGGAMTALQDAAQAITNTNLQVHIEAPAYTDIDVVFAGIAAAGFDPADVETRAEQAVLDYLSPARWGLPDSGDDRTWTETLTVRHQEISTVLNNVQGFDHWTTLTINGVASDYVMAVNAAGLPDFDSTATGTVT